MESLPTAFPVYVEIGTKRAFAGAVDWPGWNRGARDEGSALTALLAYGPRYAAALQAVDLDLHAPAGLELLVVVERLPGDGGTNFGVPSIIPSSDRRPLAGDDHRLASVLRAGWLAFQRAVAAAEGKELRTGPRGGGRDLPAMIRHVVEANWAYLCSVAWKPDKKLDDSPLDQLHRQLTETFQVIARAVAGEHPRVGPRGGKVWPARTYVRRVAWHMLDHAWELEDRVI